MNITITMAKTMDKFTKKFLSHSLKSPKTAERRGEYDRKKKWGQEGIQPHFKQHFLDYVSLSG